jgi:Tol biopolymer transport system component
MDEDGSKRRRLTDTRPSGSNAAGNLNPVWSPQGDRIAFVGSGDATDRDENLLELYVMDVETGETRQLTENTSRDADPTWSPDGKRIAFVRADYWATDDVETSHRVVDADGSGEEETLVQADQQVFSVRPPGRRTAAGSRTRGPPSQAGASSSRCMSCAATARTRCGSPTKPLSRRGHPTESGSPS